MFKQTAAERGGTTDITKSLVALPGGKGELSHYMLVGDTSASLI